MFTYELPLGEFFDLRSFSKARLIVQSNAFPVTAYFYIFDYRNRYWSNIYGNNPVEIPSTEVPFAAEFDFRTYGSPHEHDEEDPLLDRIKVIKLQLILKTGQNGLVLDRLEFIQ